MTSAVCGPRRLDAASEQPLGPIFAVEHFHSSQQRAMNHGWVSVARNWVAIHATRSLSNVFALRQANR